MLTSTHVFLQGHVYEESPKHLGTKETDPLQIIIFLTDDETRIKNQRAVHCWRYNHQGENKWKPYDSLPTPDCMILHF